MKCVSIFIELLARIPIQKNKRNKYRISLGHFKIHFDRGEVYRDSLHTYNEPSGKAVLYGEKNKETGTRSCMERITI